MACAWWEIWQLHILWHSSRGYTPPDSASSKHLRNFFHVVQVLIFLQIFSRIILELGAFKLWKEFSISVFLVAKELARHSAHCRPIASFLFLLIFLRDRHVSEVQWPWKGVPLGIPLTSASGQETPPVTDTNFRKGYDKILDPNNTGKCDAWSVAGVANHLS